MRIIITSDMLIHPRKSPIHILHDILESNFIDSSQVALNFLEADIPNQPLDYELSIEGDEL